MLQWDFDFSLGYLPLDHKQYKLITTFTFTFLITYFNITQLLFWILALLDLSFLATVKSLFCILFVHYHLHIPCFLCLFTYPTHSCTYSRQTYNLCVSLHALLFFFLFHNCIQVLCPIISQSGQSHTSL